ncbi:MAG: SIMPL domain-containing protein [Caulobacteraceae bacterium]|nr:SIMPL domain-containing protein [Caulobacteraceae bacterium]
MPPDEARVRLSYYAPGRTAAEATTEISARTRALDAAVRAIDPQSVTVERTDVSVTPVMREGRRSSAGSYQRIRSERRRDDSGARSGALGARSRSCGQLSTGCVQRRCIFSSRHRSRAATAREAAITDAVDKACLFRGCGHRLGRLLLVEEGANNMIAQGNRAVFAGAQRAAWRSSGAASGNAPEPYFTPRRFRWCSRLGCLGRTIVLRSEGWNGRWP